MKDARGYARGHLVPYGVSGGDRDEDGDLAADDDPEDVTTVKGEVDIYTPNLFWPFSPPLIGSSGANLLFTLGAGGTAIVGKLTADVVD